MTVTVNLPQTVPHHLANFRLFASPTWPVALRTVWRSCIQL